MWKEVEKTLFNIVYRLIFFINCEGPFSWIVLLCIYLLAHWACIRDLLLGTFTTGLPSLFCQSEARSTSSGHFQCSASFSEEPSAGHWGFNWKHSSKPITVQSLHTSPLCLLEMVQDILHFLNAFFKPSASHFSQWTCKTFRLISIKKQTLWIL